MTERRAKDVPLGRAKDSRWLRRAGGVPDRFAGVLDGPWRSRKGNRVTVLSLAAPLLGARCFERAGFDAGAALGAAPDDANGGLSGGAGRANPAPGCRVGRSIHQPC